jgi:hypothetical protein
MFEFLGGGIIGSLLGGVFRLVPEVLKYFGRSTGDPMHGPHGVEFLDAAATCFGGILAALPLVFLRM